VTEWVYGPRGEIVETIDNRGRVTKHRYDAHGREVEIERPSGRIERYTLDDAGRLVGNVIVINGHEIEGTRKRFVRDPLDRLLQMDSGTRTIVFQLDPMQDS
jgi:YD repeat-containing protein